MPPDSGAEAVPILLVPLIVGIVEAIKRAGLSSRYASLVSLAIGLAIAVGGHVALGAGAGDLYGSVLQGLALGLGAAGLYSVSSAVVKRPRHPSADAFAQGRAQ